MIEESLKALSEAVKENTGAIRALTAALAANNATAHVAKVTTIEQVSPQLPVQPPITYAQLVERLLKLASTKGKDTAVALLKTYNVSKATELKPEQYPSFMLSIAEAESI